MKNPLCMLGRHHWTPPQSDTEGTFHSCSRCRRVARFARRWAKPDLIDIRASDLRDGFGAYGRDPRKQ